MWGIVKDTIGKTNKNNNIKIKVNNQTITDQQEIANAFNEYFSTIGKNMAEKIVNENLKNPLLIQEEINPQSQPVNSIFLHPVTETEIDKIIKELNNHSASGIDKIQSRFIKITKEYLIPPLTYIINLMLSLGTFPEELKFSIITPVYKGGEKLNINNYRPISVVNQFAKIFEKVIATRLNKHLCFNNILSNSQFGFRPKRSTEDALFCTMKTIYDSLNNNQRCLAVFMDLAKAFDSVSHDILISKLQKYGVRGIALNLFEDYLNNRKQAVKIENNISSSTKILYGVPQGTVLGPILFLCYINDLLKCDVGGRVVSYADDTILIFSGSNWSDVQDKSERGIYLVKLWLNKHLLSLNINKTKFIPFSYNIVNQSPNNTLTMHWNCTMRDCTCICSIKRVDDIKYLGVVLDGFLRWDKHIEFLIKKLRGLLYTLRQIRCIFNKKFLIIIYRALVESVITYGIIVWGGIYNSFIEPLAVLKRLILKTIMFKDRQFPTELLYEEVKLLDLRNLYILKSLQFSYKNPILRPSINHNQATRSTLMDAVRVPRAGRTKNQYFITYLAPLFYNRLPIEIRELNNINIFTKRIAIFLLKNKNIFTEVTARLG